MLDPQFLIYGIYFLVATSVTLVVETVFIGFRARRDYRRRVNDRLRRQGANPDIERVLIQLRKERGLDDQGNYRYPLVYLNRLYLQSGKTGNALGFLLRFVVAGLAVGGVVFALTHSPIPALAAGLFLAFALPALVLLRLRARRRKKFAEQLPEAIDVVVRSLKAGHPAPVSLSLVARELSDPIGTEFGLVCDEMTYGLDINQAMRNLLERVGLDDLRLIVVSMGVQSATGGNLAEILANLATVIRDRFRMKRKIRALSAEGRWSAVLISIFPFGLFAVIAAISQSYYGEVWNHPLVQPALAGMVIWMFVGDYIMYRMVNFDF